MTNWRSRFNCRFRCTYLFEKKTDANTFADIIVNYYNKGEYKNRVNDFVKLTFPELKKSSD